METKLVIQGTPQEIRKVLQTLASSTLSITAPEQIVKITQASTPMQGPNPFYQFYQQHKKTRTITTTAKNRPTRFARNTAENLNAVLGYDVVAEMREGVKAGKKNSEIVSPILNYIASRLINTGSNGINNRRRLYNCINIIRKEMNFPVVPRGSGAARKPTNPAPSLFPYTTPPSAPKEEAHLSSYDKLYIAVREMHRDGMGALKMKGTLYKLFGNRMSKHAIKSMFIKAMYEIKQTNSVKNTGKLNCKEIFGCCATKFIAQMVNDGNTRREISEIMEKEIGKKTTLPPQTIRRRVNSMLCTTYTALKKGKVPLPQSPDGGVPMMSFVQKGDI